VALVAVRAPEVVITLTSTVPIPGGEVAVMDVALLTITDVAGAFPK
jgi:hypothetical protein